MPVAEGRIRLSVRNNLYARLSGLSYAHDLTFEETARDGTGAAAAAGWAMRFDSGIGIEASYEYLRLGSDISIGTLSFGIVVGFCAILLAPFTIVSFIV